MDQHHHQSANPPPWKSRSTLPVTSSSSTRGAVATNESFAFRMSRLSRSIRQLCQIMASVGSCGGVPVLHLRRRRAEWALLSETGFQKTVRDGDFVRDSGFAAVRVTRDGRNSVRDDRNSTRDDRNHDSYGKKNVDHGSFVLCPLYGRKSKAFQAATGTTNSAIISNLTKTAKLMVGVSLSVDSSQSLTVTEYIKQRAKEAVGAETPCGGGLGEHGDAVSRQLILTKVSLVERRPDNYEVVIVRPLSSVSSLVRFSEEPQMFAIEFNDGCSIHVYASTSRDSLLAAICDLLQTEVVNVACLIVSLSRRPLADVESSSIHLKHLAAAAKDAVAEGGSIPGSRAKLWRRIREFNACIPYSGVPPTVEVPEVTLMALITMLPATPNLPPESPSLPPPSPKAAATVMGFIACLHRLLASKNAASHVVSFPAAVGRIMGLLRNGSEGVAAEAARLVAALIGVLEAMICDPNGETTQYTVFVELLRQVAGLKRRLFALFAHPAESVRETVAVVMRTIAEEDAIAAESMRDAALRDGALLRHLLHAFFLPAGERREVSRQLVALWADSYQPALDLLSRVLPPGLVAYLHTRPDGVPEESMQEGSLTSDAARQTNSGFHRVADNHQKSIADPTFSQVLKQSSAAHTVESLNTDAYSTGISQNGHSIISASNDYPSTNVRGVSETNASNSVFSDVNVIGSHNTGLPAPAQVVVENTPVGSGCLLCNWPEFWRAFSLDHNRADLIWNERTRQELREALQAEVHKLVLRRNGLKIFPGDATVESMSGQDSVPRISWNYSEFSVSYPSLSKEVCVGQYYLRLLLESGNSGRAQDFPLRDPVAFFGALYHRFLCDADIGLTVDGAVPDELGSSDDWCDMSRLDGFGGGGGSSVRELCARAMAIVYEQHCNTIGPFEGTAHITVLLDRTDDRALRHRLLLLLKVLLLTILGFNEDFSKYGILCLVGGCVLAVDLLTVVHEASERTAIPLQSNLIAASAFMEPLKEWMYIDKDGAQVGPLEKDAVRRLWSKKAIDWTTRCWASGMPDWKRLQDIRELRWALSVRVPVLTPPQVLSFTFGRRAALSVLHSMVSAHSDLDDAGEIVTPTPRVNGFCQVHVAFPYCTGAFYFALAYPGSNLLSIAQLFSVTHVHQAFHGGEEAAVSSSLPLAKRSVLGGLLPESLLYVLERSGPSVFAAAMVSESDTPEIIGHIKCVLKI
ncbi:DnaJ-like protein subfamily C GRV2 [Hibiscus syriacus]|uniref:DnaJ-like protein subfamily C GRV2 n=1 Tax=Hibiscus syriacus TaxID=106335 RepID=A0A6A3D0W4_HIBSY|nr:DnaJ-like protein subfamily C GRV2 [Hibiscus syriacus]